MNKKVLYCKEKSGDSCRILKSLEAEGYSVIEYDEIENDILELLSSEFFYFVISAGFREDIYRACMGTATKYMILYTAEQNELVERLKREKSVNCYFCLLTKEHLSNISNYLFNDKEWDIYTLINEIYRMHSEAKDSVIGLSQLGTIKDEAEMNRLTDVFFDTMESEKSLYIVFMEQLFAYVELLLSRKSIEAWKEILLWNKRHECCDLKNISWKFFLLKKAGDIFAEEMQEYVNGGRIPFMTEIGSFQELYDIYFQLLFLLRRLEYDIAPEDNQEIVCFIAEHGISAVFVKHVIEHNKIFNKKKVYVRLGELLSEYER